MATTDAARTHDAMPTLEHLQGELQGRTLPGATLIIGQYQSQIADHALLAPDLGASEAHPLWFVIASLRGLGITVEELCALAAMRPYDTLLLGEIIVEHDDPMYPGKTYTTTAAIGSVERRTTRDGSILDSAAVTVHVAEDDGRRVGSVTSNYLFKRGRS